MRVSRRAVLTVTGAGLLAVASGISLVSVRGCGRAPAVARSDANYADYEGWMLTADDKQKLAGTPGHP